MSHVRILSRILVVLALLGSAMALATSPASAQDQEPADLRVVIMRNIDDETDTNWQVRVKVTAFGGCTPEQGLGGDGFQSTWIREKNEVSTSLNVAVCSYGITAQGAPEHRRGVPGGTRLGRQIRQSVTRLPKLTCLASAERRREESVRQGRHAQD